MAPHSGVDAERHEGVAMTMSRGMTMRITATGFTVRPARHRGAGRWSRALGRGVRSLVVSAAAAMIVLAMVTSDPVSHVRG